LGLSIHTTATCLLQVPCIMLPSPPLHPPPPPPLPPKTTTKFPLGTKEYCRPLVLNERKCPACSVQPLVKFQLQDAPHLRSLCLHPQQPAVLHLLRPWGAGPAHGLQIHDGPRWDCPLSLATALYLHCQTPSDAPPWLLNVFTETMPNCAI